MSIPSSAPNPANKTILLPVIKMLVLLLLLVTGLNNAIAAPFQQDGNGLVSIEAESYAATSIGTGGHAWQHDTTYTGYSGVDSMRALPEDRVNWDVDYAANSPGMDYQIDFTSTGTHYIWVRGLGPSTSSDSLHIGLNSVEVAGGLNFKRFTNNWGWSNSGGRTINIDSVGIHTLNIWMRESGMIFDKIVLTTDPNYIPTGNGPAESSSGGTPTVIQPAISPNSGTYADSATISISTLTTGAAIYYTTDGSAPTTASTPYTAPFSITNTTTVNARAYLTGYNDSTLANATITINWPTNGWLAATPLEMGMDPVKLTQARDYVSPGTNQDSGFIIKSGKLVFSWGDQTTKYDIKSSTKSIGSMIFGLAIDDGLVNPADLAKSHYASVGTPPLTNLDTGWMDALTMQQLATHTGGFDKNGDYISQTFQPGTIWSYSDGGANWLADVLTVINNDDLYNIFQNRVMAPLGLDTTNLGWRSNINRDPTINGITSREFGAGVSADIDAMARIGYLMLNRGLWDGQRILSDAYINLASQSDPSLVGLSTNNSAKYFNATSHYGFLWWNNNDGTMPNIPTDTYWSWGAGDSLIIVIPSKDIVIARAGTSWRAGWNADYTAIEPFLNLIIESDQGAPVLTLIGNQTIDEEQTLTFTVSSYDPIDPASPFLTADLSALPAGASFIDNGDGTGTFSWTPVAGDSTGSPYSATFTATDATDPTLISTETISIAVNPPLTVNPFQQDVTGLLSFEVENYHFNQGGTGGHTWIEDTTYSGFSGLSSMTAAPEDRVNWDVDFVANSPRMDYQVEIITPGTHYLWVRGYGPGTSSDSIHVGLDGASTIGGTNFKKFGVGGWNWSNSG
ncbi:MAG: serine hydrolase, partial [Proteobacteria bacterium]|nr:serine hydrolase [Pseudomonadota bacterium]